MSRFVFLAKLIPPPQLFMMQYLILIVIYVTYCQVWVL